MRWCIVTSRVYCLYTWKIPSDRPLHWMGSQFLQGLNDQTQTTVLRLSRGHRERGHRTGRLYHIPKVVRGVLAFPLYKDSICCPTPLLSSILFDTLSFFTPLTTEVGTWGLRWVPQVLSQPTSTILAKEGKGVRVVPRVRWCIFTVTECHFNLCTQKEEERYTRELCPFYQWHVTSLYCLW